ncbi:DUF3298 domain-containing protein [Leptotrichia sp. oral taxon 218]|jgi:hypothetical protein|uniref:DUF3298 domain-containing protein n=1 Tax=Leptotrichia sp. oral taxon 218 TaxID=712361 RepID=UPI001B8CBF07|nr:DUF3298 domain-containing protein [Leptotrichia sp. oral taxon 218]QUB94898.1 DUF3298 domain-containing protein [Leptotrichia sp. oral taxon 218]
MKKLTLLFMALLMFNLSFAKQKEKVDTTFTFANLNTQSESGLTPLKRTKILGKSRVEYFAFSGKKPDIAKEMNKSMEKFIQQFKSTKNKTYTVTSKVTANNGSFVSVAFNIVEKDSKAGILSKETDGITFNTKSGKSLLLKDLFVPNYEKELENLISVKFTELGLPKSDEERFKGVSKKTNFYLENDALILVYNNNLGTSFADGQAFIPFLLKDLEGIIQQ